MSDDNIKQFTKILTDEDLSKILEQDKEVAFEELEANQTIKQLQFFRNLRMYLDKMVGKEWLLLYLREEDGTPVFVPNNNLSIKDHVFLSRLSENIAFQMISLEGEDDT